MKKDKSIKLENKKSNVKKEPKKIKQKKRDANAESQKASFGSEMFSEAIVKNPVLVSTIGLCPVVAICTSLKSALMLSVITYITMIFTQILSAALFKSCPQWLRVALYTLSGMAVVAPSMLFLENMLQEDMVALGIYLPLLAINPLITRQCERVAIKETVNNAFINAVCCATGYSAVLIIMGFVRELLGSGTFWDLRVFSAPPVPSITTPFAGFIILAFMSALLRVYFKKIDPQYAEELAVQSRSSIKKPKPRKERPSDEIYDDFSNEPFVKDEFYETIQNAQNEQQSEELSVQEVAQNISEPIQEEPETYVVEEQYVQPEYNDAEFAQEFEYVAQEQPVILENGEQQMQDNFEYAPSKEEKREVVKRKIEYSSMELEELLSKSLDDLIYGTSESDDNKKGKNKANNKQYFGEVPEK